MIEVRWAATSLESGRFEALVESSHIEALEEHFAALKEQGEGYLEVRGHDDYPVLTMGFRGSVAVIQAFTSQAAISVLEGDGSVHQASVEVPVMDEDAVFSGHLGIETDRAWSVVQGFICGSALVELGKWFVL